MLRDIILSQKKQKEQFLKKQYIERKQDQFGKKWLSSSLVKVVLGPRRTGKSVYSFMLLKNRPFMYFNFDDDILASIPEISTIDLMKELHESYGSTKTILFDEIQNLPRWELFANRLHREGYNLVVTGSNAHLLSKEFATHLTGRHMPIEIMPFDFNEFLRAKNFTIDYQYISLPEQKGAILNLMNDYLHNGGFPEVAINNLDPEGYFDVLIDALLFKDVIKRHNVKLSTKIGNLGMHLINNFASLYTIRKLLGIMNLQSATTTEKYIKYLEEAYLIFSLMIYSLKSVQRIKSPRKAYVVDNGFITAKAIQGSRDNGKLMENLVFTELVKRGYNAERELFYYKTRNNREVDFVIKKGYQAIELIQASFDITNPDVEKREIKALIEAGEELNVEKLTIITWDTKREVKSKTKRTIEFIPLWEWLLEKNK